VHPFIQGRRHAQKRYTVLSCTCPHLRKRQARQRAMVENSPMSTAGSSPPAGEDVHAQPALEEAASEAAEGQGRERQRHGPPCTSTTKGGVIQMQGPERDALTLRSC